MAVDQDIVRLLEGRGEELGLTHFQRIMQRQGSESMLKSMDTNGDGSIRYVRHTMDDMQQTTCNGHHAANQ